MRPGPNIERALDPNLPTSHSTYQDVSCTIMAAKWPRIFDTFAHRAFKASEQPDGLQVPGQWVDLIGGIPNLSNTFYQYLFGQHERCLDYILSSVARVVLAILTVWPTSLNPTIEKRRVYYKQPIWNPDGMHLENLLWKKVTIDGVEHLRCNQRKFPVQLLRQSDSGNTY